MSGKRSLENLFEAKWIPELLQDDAGPRPEPNDRTDRLTMFWCHGEFRSGDTLSGLIRLCCSILRHPLHGQRSKDDVPMHVYLKHPSFHSLIFYGDYEIEDGGNGEGNVTVVDRHTKQEIKKIHCSSAEGRRELIQFFIDWSRAHPPPPSKRPATKKNTAAEILAQRAIRPKGQRGLHASGEVGRSRSGLSIVLEESRSQSPDPARMEQLSLDAKESDTLYPTDLDPMRDRMDSDPFHSDGGQGQRGAEFTAYFEAAEHVPGLSESISVQPN